MNTQSQYGYSYLKPTLYYNNSNINIDNNLYLYVIDSVDNTKLPCYI